MDCSTCGAPIPVGRAGCATCGSRVALSGSPAHLTAGADVTELGLGGCPRCGYRGEGLPYFSRGLHTAVLVLLTFFTAPFFAVGGVAYYFARRHHRVCPRCGGTWHSREVGASAVPIDGSLVGRESTPRGTTILLWLMGALLVMGALMLGEELLDDDWIPLLLAGVAVATGVGGWMLHRRAHGGREERRAALLTELQPPVLRLAAERGGRLTVTQAAADLGWTLRRTEKVLASLDDGFRVSSEVTDQGVIVYEFRELIHLP